MDASSEGLGAVILQSGQPVSYGLRALTDRERNYAQIEKELLAIVQGCENFHQYLYGCCIQVESDHKRCLDLARDGKANIRCFQ